MRFIYPWMLLLLPLVAIISLVAMWLLYRKNTKQSLFAVPSILVRSSVARAGNGKGEVRYSIVPQLQLWLLSAGLLFIAFAASRPQWGRQDVVVSSAGRNLLIALDVSRSMLAEDVRPNRLERAKVDLLDLINDLKGDRAGIIAFRGKAITLSPLTIDYAFLRQTIDGISIDSAPRGETDLAEAIEECLDVLEKAADDNNAILLISDGEDLAGRAQKLAKTAGERGIPIFTIGIGDTSGAAVPSEDGKGVMKFGGQEVRSRLTEGTLREIADNSGGAYIPLATSSTAATTLGAIYRNHLTKIAAKEYEEMMENRYIERYQLFLIPGLVLLLIAGALSKGRLASAERLPRRVES